MHCYQTQSISYSWLATHTGDKGGCETDCKMCWLKVHARGTEAACEYMNIFLQKIIDYKSKLVHTSFPDCYRHTATDLLIKLH